MSYRPPRQGHYMSMTLEDGVRYAVCNVPGCSQVRRMWGLKPLLHNGRKP